MLDKDLYPEWLEETVHESKIQDVCIEAHAALTAGDDYNCNDDELGLTGIIEFSDVVCAVIQNKTYEEYADCIHKLTLGDKGAQAVMRMWLNDEINSLIEVYIK